MQLYEECCLVNGAIFMQSPFKALVQGSPEAPKCGFSAKVSALDLELTVETVLSRADPQTGSQPLVHPSSGDKSWKTVTLFEA